TGHANIAEDDGIHEDDVGHDHEGGQARTHLEPDGGTACAELEPPLEGGGHERRDCSAIAAGSASHFLTPRTSLLDIGAPPSRRPRRLLREDDDGWIVRSS